jgi:hypothetical protein
MPARLERLHPQQVGHANEVTPCRGPLLYCLERADNPDVDLFRVEFVADEPWTATWEADCLGGIVVRRRMRRRAACQARAERSCRLEIGVFRRLRRCRGGLRIADGKQLGHGRTRTTSSNLVHVGCCVLIRLSARPAARRRAGKVGEIRVIRRRNRNRKVRRCERFPLGYPTQVTWMGRLRRLIQATADRRRGGGKRKAPAAVLCPAGIAFEMRAPCAHVAG